MEALINFQTLVCDLSGMAIANGSMLDEATSAAEAVTLAKRSVKSKSNTLIVASDVHPQTIEVIQTRCAPIGITVLVGMAPVLMSEHDHFAVVCQYPSTTGLVHDLKEHIDAAHAKNAAFIVCADLLALTLLVPPGELGADIVVGNTQRLGMPMGCGGPHAAFLACRDEFKRSMPGRLVGVSKDAQGHPAYRLALQTREQHIRREKATSNICTAQVLPAVVASMYAVYHGPEGLKRIAERVASFTAILADGLGKLGCKVVTPAAFDTITVECDAATVMARAVAAGANLRRLSDKHVAVALDETTTRFDLEALWSWFAPASTLKVADYAAGIESLIPAALRRTSSFLSHPVFNTHHSETEMLRYIRSLSDKDLALDRSMIPLGSCTMKLNATTEMIPITWPEFANLHPFAPQDQLAGYTELDAQLRAWLTQCTGYAGISLQPNAGSQGEYAGLLAIKAWHESRGDAQRTICLIPESAHGTNPASAQMCGMSVVVTKCDKEGNIDLADLKAKCEQHADKLAAIMITYPSTYGVFDTHVKEICQLVRSHGGRVYVDGANMNALVGVAAPGEFGGDVSHLNLHKTFCIPHGGGGPGVGPVCVVDDLVPFLPAHRTAGLGSETNIGAVSAAAAGQCGGAADQLDVHPPDGRRWPEEGHRGRDPQRELRRGAPVRALRHPLQRQHRRRQGRRRRPRVHPRSAPLEGNQRRQRRGRGQAFDRLRLPRADAELPGCRHADGRTDRERKPRRTGPIHRRDGRDPPGDRDGRGGRVAEGRQPADPCPAHGDGLRRQRMGPCLWSRSGGVPGAELAPRQVLVASRPRRQRVWRPQSVLQLRAAERVRRGLRPCSTARLCG